ncbi:MAG: biotin transporter BioY [Aeromicrobium sp.]
MASTSSALTTRASTRQLSTTDLALVSSFAALIAVCAILPGIHPSGIAVPITLQTFAVMLAGAALGPWRGFLANILYLVVGFAGLPIFADHHGGPSTFSSPSIGYLLSFPVAALVVGFLVKYVARERRISAIAIFLCSAVGSILVIHPAGIAGLAWRLDVPLTKAADIDKVYWLGDFVKTAFIAMVAAEVHRAFPHLLSRRKAQPE